MNTEVKSEYYLAFPENMEKHQVPKEAWPFAAEEFQGLEEMFFGFVMFLIS